VNCGGRLANGSGIVSRITLLYIRGYKALQLRLPLGVYETYALYRGVSKPSKTQKHEKHERIFRTDHCSSLEMKRKLIVFSIWIIFTVVAINAIWLFVFVISSIFDLDTLIPKRENIHITFLSLSFGIVILATLLNISLNLTLIADRQAEAEKHARKQTPITRQLFYVGAVVLVLVVVLVSFDYYKKHRERRMIINRWSKVIDEYDHQVKEISESLLDSAKLARVPAILKDFASHRIENPSMTVIFADTIKGHLEFVEVASTFGDAEFYKRFPKPVIYRAQDGEIEYLQKVLTTSSLETHLTYEEGYFRLFLPIDEGKRKFVLLFVDYEEVLYERH
jgi:uncharacterized membrane protein